MGNSNSRSTFNDKSHPHSKSIPNLGSLPPHESEQLYFAHALKLQEQYLLSKNLRLQRQYNEQHRNYQYQAYKDPGSRYSMNINSYGDAANQQQLNVSSLLNDQAESYTKTKPKPPRKLNKFLNKLTKDQSTDGTSHPMTSHSAKGSSLSRSLNHSKGGHSTKSLATRSTGVEAEIDFSYGKARMSVGNRLSCVDSLKFIDDNMRSMNLSSNSKQTNSNSNQYGSIRSIDLNDSYPQKYIANRDR
jgi:hypothetical protein